MKKIIAIFVLVTLSVVLFCGCGKDDDYDTDDYYVDTGISSSEALETAKEMCQSECFSKASRTNGYFDYGTEDVKSRENGEWEVDLKGYFYPKDSYGDYDKYKYRFTYDVVIYPDGTDYVIYKDVSKVY